MHEYKLLVREDLFPHWILYVLLGTTILLAFLKYIKAPLFLHLRLAFYRPINRVPFTKEETNFFGISNWLLLLNYFITASLMIYMILIYKDIQLYWLLLFPVVYYLLQILTLYSLGGISGETKRLKENLMLTNLTNHFIGLAFLPLLIIMLLHPHWSAYIISIAGILFLLLHLLRIWRGVFTALRNKVLWYYIILYLCHLEIWPIILFFVVILPISAR